MTENTARTVANVMLTAAAVGVVWYVARTPSLRRMAGQLAATALTATLPTWFSAELRQAWSETDRRAI